MDVRLIVMSFELWILMLAWNRNPSDDKTPQSKNKSRVLISFWEIRYVFCCAFVEHSTIKLERFSMATQMFKQISRLASEKPFSKSKTNESVNIENSQLFLLAFCMPMREKGFWWNFHIFLGAEIPSLRPVTNPNVNVKAENLSWAFRRLRVASVSSRYLETLMLNPQCCSLMFHAQDFFPTRPS